jgi:chitinase
MRPSTRHPRSRRTGPILALALSLIGSGLVAGTTPAGAGAGSDEALPVITSLGNGTPEGDDARSAEVPTLTPGVATVAEGDTGTTTVEVPVTLSEPTDEPVTATWQTIHGPGIEPPNPATPGDDFTAANGTITFAPGETTAHVPIDITGDTTLEPNEAIVVSFTNVTGARTGGYWGLGFARIDDDDTPPTPPALQSATITTVEGNAGTTSVQLPVSLSKPWHEDITITWATEPRSGCLFVCQATVGVDYAAASGSLTIPTGQTTATVTLTVYGDTDLEPLEIFAVGFSAPATSNRFLYGTVRIGNDD